MTKPLNLMATIERTSFPVGVEIRARVTLANGSGAPLWVNRRMGVGYEDGAVRELYFTVRDRTGKILPVPDDARVDAHRLPPTRDEFEYLAPGGLVSTVVDLSMWYPFRQPGRYSVTLTYENVWDGKQFGIHAFTGKVSADPLWLEIQ